MHRKKFRNYLIIEPEVFRNTELAYNNDLGQWAEEAGFKGMLAEGWDPVLGWKTSNYMYQAYRTQNIRCYLKITNLAMILLFALVIRLGVNGL
jgi:alpha-amylase